MGGRLKPQDATPSPILKGMGRKRFGQPPSPTSKQASKRATADGVDEGGEATSKNKRNLMGGLNEAADSSGIVGQCQKGESLIPEEDVPEKQLSSPSSPGQNMCFTSLEMVVVQKEEGTMSKQELSPEKGGEPVTPEQETVGVLSEGGGLVQSVQAGTLAVSHLECYFEKETKRDCESKKSEKSNVAGSWSTAETPFVSCLHNDLHLDLVSAQPLQASGSPVQVSQRRQTEDVVMVVENQPEMSLEFEEKFPVLNKGIAKSLKAKFEGMQQDANSWLQKCKNLEEKGVARGQSNNRNTYMSSMTQEQHQQPEIVIPIPKAMDKPTMVNKVKNGEAIKKNGDPFVLQPEKISKIGCSGLREGRPALSFSVEDTAYLTEKMGHAIVGKFSHSIPSSAQVQKMLGGISFVRGYSWNYINAKHIIIQFDDIEDYAKMLNGPNGSPVWFIDHHPMRVFKWTPTFDSFFETPIATVWCNIIAVPIHLFELSALYAIGSLLGNPIQLDHATANKSRLSFARICVEIDITKPPTEEVIIDILGKETVLKVKWDKIPLYCRECKHVGHSSRNCHAMGKTETAARPSYYNTPRQGAYRPRQQSGATSGPKGYAAEPKKQQELVKQGNASQVPHAQQKEKEVDQINLAGSSGSYERPKSHTFADFIPEEGFARQGRRGKKGKQGAAQAGCISRSSSADKVLVENLNLNKEGPHPDFSSLTTDHVGRREQGIGDHSSLLDWSLKRFEKPNYFKHLEQGEFVDTGDVNEDDMQEDPGQQEAGEGAMEPATMHINVRRETGDAVSQKKEGKSTPIPSLFP